MSHITDYKQISVIQNLISVADRFLILISKPVDPDCVGTGLAIRWWLEQQHKQARILSLFPIPETMHSFPDIEVIRFLKPESFSATDNEIVILVDGSSWMQFLGSAWRHILKRLDITKIINIDHHEPDDIYDSIPDLCVRQKSSSTAQLFFETFLSSFSFKPPARVADYLYRALVYDTRNFRNEHYPGMFQFAEALINLGADHARVNDVQLSRKEIDFLLWAIQHTQYFPQLQSTLLAVPAEQSSDLEASFGPNWQDYDSLYKEVFLRQIAGYNYGLILIDNRDGTIKLSWRTRSYGCHCSIADIAQKAGFKAGGHRNAGGGIFTGDLRSAQALLLAALESSLQQQTQKIADR